MRFGKQKKIHTAAAGSSPTDTNGTPTVSAGGKAVLHRQLERSKKMESLGLLAGAVARDLNNVLSGIVSYPDLLLMDLPDADID